MVTRQRKSQLKSIRNKKCIKCSLKIADNSRFCLFHKEQNKRLAARARARAIKEKRCIQCFGDLDLAAVKVSKIRCSKCLAYQAKAQQRVRDRKKGRV